MEKNKDEGKGEVGSAEEVNFEMGENSMGSKEGTSGDNVQVSCVCESVLLSPYEDCLSVVMSVNLSPLNIQLPSNSR